MIFELDGWTIEIDEKVIHPGYPECRKGHPDHWSQAEGADIEYISARVIRNGREKNISPKALINCLERRGVDIC